MSLETVFTDEVVDGRVRFNVPLLSTETRLYLVSVFNTFTVDYLLRQRVSAHVSFFYVYNLPIPFLPDGDARLSLIVNRAARLVCTGPEFDDFAREVGLRGHADGATEEAALEQYRRFAAPQADAEIGPLLAQGEGPRVEFKSSARWDLVKNEKNGELEKVIVKTVCGFLNAEGGTLLIGVDDAAAVLGLENDFRTVKGKGRDGYEVFLRRLLLDAVGKDCTLQLGITFHSADGKDLCRVVVAPSPRPVFLTEGADEHLYVRSGNATRRLTSKETVNYVKIRWTS